MEQSDVFEAEQAFIFARPSTKEDVRINYTECRLRDLRQIKDTILLIHGFPLTNRQFRHVTTPLARAGYRIIAPDYTGAGGSSKPTHEYSKQALGDDLHQLMVELLGKEPRFHVVAHDIGGMIGHSLTSSHPESVKSVVLGECPIPGTWEYKEDSKNNAIANFHFQLHSHPDLAVALITGREEVYIRYFFDKQAYRTSAITDDDVAAFVKAYSQPGALRAACLTYSAFELDAQHNLQRLQSTGTCRVPALGLAGARSHHAGRAEGMLKQLYADVEAVDLEQAGHYIAMENPEAFVREVLSFVGKHV